MPTRVSKLALRRIRARSKRKDALRAWRTLPIMVWRFEYAPEEYRKLSTNGGDEDWVAFVPSGFPGHAWIPWLELNGAGHFGICGTEEFDVPSGRVFIGSHA